MYTVCFELLSCSSFVLMMLNSGEEGILLPRITGHLVVGFSRWNVAPNYPRQTLTFNYPNLLILEPELDLNTIEGKEKIHFRPSIYVHVHACTSQYSVGRGLAVPLNTARQYARRNSMPPFPRGPWIHHSSRALRDGIHFRHTPIVSPVIVAFYKEGKCEGGVGK